MQRQPGAAGGKQRRCGNCKSPDAVGERKPSGWAGFTPELPLPVATALRVHAETQSLDRETRDPPPPHRFLWEGEGGSSRVLVLSELRCSKKFSLPLPRGRALGVPERRPGAAPRGGTRRQNSGSAARPSLRPPLVSQVPRSEDFQPCPPLQLGLPAEVLLRWAFVNPRPRQVSKA